MYVVRLYNITETDPCLITICMCSQQTSDIKPSNTCGGNKALMVPEATENVSLSVVHSIECHLGLNETYCHPAMIRWLCTLFGVMICWVVHCMSSLVHCVVHLSVKL